MIQIHELCWSIISLVVLNFMTRLMILSHIVSCGQLWLGFLNTGPDY